MAALKLCLLSSEIMPYAKSGGLADVSGAILQEIRRLGHDVRGFMPLYSSVLRTRPDLQPVLGLQNVGITIGGVDHTFSLRTGSYPGTDIPMYFVESPAMFERGVLYTTDPDEHRRFILFTRAVLESCRRLKFAPDIVHCNDWHTAFLPLYLKTTYAGEATFAHARSVMTIHNIGYQGIMPASAIDDLGLPAAHVQLDAEDLSAGIINPLRTGLRFADAVTTVSPTYAREITGAEQGMGMERTLRARREGVVGILNGVDYHEWDPVRDPHLTTHFDANHLDGKRTNKQELLAAFGLSATPERPLVSMVTRLAEQKGIDLLVEALPRLLSERDFNFCILGSGDERYVNFFRELARGHHGRVAFREGYDEALAHRIEAGSDVFLMPSRYEPCGLNQMYSLRYGTIPVVRGTGGLADSVQHFNPATGEGTGCVFNDYDVNAVVWGLNTTLDWYAAPGTWRVLVSNAMAQDFSWSRQAVRYEQVYRDAIARVGSSSA